MTDLHDLCKFQRQIDQSYVDELKNYLKAGIPATYTTEEANNYINNLDDEPTSTTTPLHLICTHVPSDISDEEGLIVSKMVEILFEYGAGWCLIDENDHTPGCILINRKLTHYPIYDQIVQAGIRAELLLRKVGEYDVEIIDNDGFKEYENEYEQNEEGKNQENQKALPFEPEPKASEPLDERYDLPDAPSHNQQSYLNTKLEYTEDSLITKDRKDGVMMSWETDLMQLGCDSLFEGSYIDQSTKELDAEINILNIGFGMGIIDKMIQLKTPTKHYICEAHPDVLQKLKQDGWYEKSNVVILEGRWQDNLDFLLNSGIFFNGIYYDTFSENYQDMLELFDYIVGLLKPNGVFSFFNGLGADRQVIYEVYKQLVELDLSNYGLKCSFKQIKVPESSLKIENKSVWDDVKRSYWSCPIYYHPTAKFIDFE